MKFFSTSKKSKTVTKILAVILAVLFVLGTLATVLPTLVNATGTSRFLRVGLYYGASAVTSLALTSDTGFELGSFDSASGYFAPSANLYNTALVASFANGAGSIMTPEWMPLTSLYEGTPVYIRAAGGGNIGAGGNIYSGVLEITCMGGGLRVVNIADLEDYVKGVVVSEVYSSWPAEALKSQAVVARSFTLYSSTKHTADGFDICATQHCQAYNGIGNAVQATNDAVDATRGLVVAYNGRPALTTYHSSSGQRTESASSAWGSKPEAYPYLASVDTGFNDTVNYRNGRWSYTVSASALTEYINSKPAYEGILKGNVDSIVCESKPDSPYVYKLTVSDALGNSITVEKSTQVRNFITQYCKSACFTVSAHKPIYANEGEYMLDSENMYVITAEGPKTLKVPSSGLEVLTADGLKTVQSTVGEKLFTITGEGYGHGVGMSQYGAMTLAQQGHDYNYILSLYYPGTTIVDYTTLAP